MRCPVCTVSESIIAHTGVHRLVGEEIFQRTRVCLGCALVYEDSSPDRDWTSLYGTAWHPDVDEESHHEELCDLDVRSIGEGDGKRAFEVGCGAGFLLDRLASNGWRTAGCDPETAVAEIARAKGHAVETRSFRVAECEAVDLVVLAEVLEHDPRPLTMLAAARAMLTEGGALYLRVPDLARVSHESFGDVFDLQHRVWFTTDTLRGTLARAGLRVERLQADGAGIRAIAHLATPVVERRPRGEPSRSLTIVRRYSRELALRHERIASELAARGGEIMSPYEFPAPIAPRESVPVRRRP